MIEKFITFKEPNVIEDCDGRKGGMLFRTHVVLVDGRHVLISDAQHGEGMLRINETLAFPCDEEGNVTQWVEVAGGRDLRTDDVIREMNEM